MFARVTTRVSDRRVSERFYDLVLSTLGIPKTRSNEDLAEWGDFALGAAADGKPVTRGLHHHGALRQGGSIDHLWIRVADVAAAKRFYESVVPQAGFRLRRDTPERAQFAGESGSFSFVLGPPTENAHLSFAVRDEAAAGSFVDPDGKNRKSSSPPQLLWRSFA